MTKPPTMNDGRQLLGSPNESKSTNNRPCLTWFRRPPSNVTSIGAVLIRDKIIEHTSMSTALLIDGFLSRWISKGN